MRTRAQTLISCEEYFRMAMGMNGKDQNKVLESSKVKLRGLSPRANYTDRVAAAGRRS